MQFRGIADIAGGAFVQGALHTRSSDMRALQNLDKLGDLEEANAVSGATG
jgi:hypothetical protein